MRTMGIGQAWYLLLTQLRTDNGLVSRVAPRGQPTREILGHRLSFDLGISNVIDCPARKLNYRFMVAEWLWIALGLDDVELLARFNSRMRAFSDDGRTLAGAYGPRIAPQWDWARRQLLDDAETRQAVIGIWTPTPAPSRDIPCTLTLQFLRRGGKLHGIASMRSSDAWLGIPYDAFSFSQLLSAMAGETLAEPGSLTFLLGSSHLYERDLAAASAIDAAGGFPSPRLPGRPPAWLEGVLRNPHAAPTDDELRAAWPWPAYAAVLRSDCSADAHEILLGLVF